MFVEDVINDGFMVKIRSSRLFSLVGSLWTCVIPMLVVVSIRHRPFNLQGGYAFFFRSEISFRTTRELEYFFFLLRKARIFFPEFNLRLYDKNSESNYFFPPPKSEYFFQQHWESEYFFRKQP